MTLILPSDGIAHLEAGIRTMPALTDRSAVDDGRCAVTRTIRELLFSEQTTVMMQPDGDDDVFSSEETMVLLQALLPRLKAGLDALTRLKAHRDVLDTLTEALIAYGHDARQLYCNTAFVSLLDMEPERERLLAEIQHFAQQVYLFPPTDIQGEAAFASAPNVIRTSRARYDLKGTLITPGAFEGEANVVISVSCTARPTLPSPTELRDRHALTRREAEVALLLAEGYSNDEMAGRLYISPHTARRHTERVLEKLGLHSRKALALKLMQGDL